MLKRFEMDEMTRPSPRKIDGDRVVHETGGLVMPKEHGRPVLCDFGEARYGQATYTRATFSPTSTVRRR